MRNIFQWSHGDTREDVQESLYQERLRALAKNDIDMLVLKTHFEPETPAKLFCLTEGVTSSVRSMSSFDKCKERTSSTERPKYLIEDAVVSDANHVETNNVNAELPKDEVASTANCPRTIIVNVEEESCDDSTSELPHLELMDRILRLEYIVDVIKAGKN